MSAILPPSKRIWWKQPLDRIELTWILIALMVVDPVFHDAVLARVR